MIGITRTGTLFIDKTHHGKCVAIVIEMRDEWTKCLLISLDPRRVRPPNQGPIRWIPRKFIDDSMKVR